MFKSPRWIARHFRQHPIADFAHRTFPCSVVGFVKKDCSANRLYPSGFPHVLPRSLNISNSFATKEMDDVATTTCVI
jgi:hypothetical protein